jgi:hypothetical protein
VELHLLGGEFGDHVLFLCPVGVVVRLNPSLGVDGD